MNTEQNPDLISHLAKEVLFLQRVIIVDIVLTAALLGEKAVELALQLWA